MLSWLIIATILLGVLYIVTKVARVVLGRYILEYFVNSDIVFTLREFNGNDCTARELETHLISPLVNLPSWMVRNEYEFAFSSHLKSAIIYGYSFEPKNRFEGSHGEFAKYGELL